jgi:acyl-CoA synthetase (AMP-forming)/AMP-acid ligase II
MKASPLVDALVRGWSGRQPERVALETPSRRFTYGDLERSIDGLAERLVSEGVTPGDRVVLVLPASPEYVVSLLAVTRVGGIAVPVPPTAGPDRRRYLVELTAPRLCLVGASTAAAGLPCDVLTIEPG